MHILYVIQSKRNLSFYIGITADLRKRLKEHNKGLVFSTKSKRPWILVYCEGYRSREDAMERERKLKKQRTSWIRIKERIKNSLLLEQG
jgi:putative endonuclease